VLVYRRVSREPLTGGFSKYHTKLCNSLNFDPAIHDCLCYLPHAVNCGRFCFWRRQFVFCVCVFVYEIYRKPLNGFAPNSHGRRVTWTSLKVKVKGHKKQHFRPFWWPACGLYLVKYFQPLVQNCVQLWSRHVIIWPILLLWCMRSAYFPSLKLCWRVSVFDAFAGYHRYIENYVHMRGLFNI